MIQYNSILHFAAKRTEDFMTENKADKKIEKDRALSLRTLNYVTSAFTVIISVLMLISLYMTASSYSKVRENTDQFIICERSAVKLQAGSDYLTEQVRAFAVTGQPEYMENYFTEANVTKRREEALESVRNIISGTAAFQDLEVAMRNSVELMDREYYSMKLAALAYGIELSSCPEPVRNVALSEADEAKTKDEQAQTARNMVFDDVYKEYKKIISEATQASVGHLTESTEKMMADSLDRLNVLLAVQRVMIVVLVIVIAGIIVITTLQVIKPLLRAVPSIKEEKPLSLRGAYEYKFLAKTYNKMFEANRAQKKQLKYEATHDILTGAFNRAGFESICKSGVLDNYALIVVDIDDFKHINDNYGHDTGDRILVKAASKFKSIFRSSDFICRMGGDEFVIILNDIAAEERRESIIRRKLNYINDDLSESYDGLPDVSISAGVAFGAIEDDINEVVKAADEVLYKVKQQGKHGVMFSE